MFGLACGTCFDTGDWVNRQAHAHASTGGHVDQCIKAEFTNLALEHLIQTGLGQPQGFGCRDLGQSAGLKPLGNHHHGLGAQQQVLCFFGIEPEIHKDVGAAFCNFEITPFFFLSFANWW